MIGGVTTACVAEDGEHGEGGEGGEPATDRESEVDSSLTSTQLRGEWNYFYAGGPFGASFNVVQGGACSPFRDRAYFTVERATGSGHCDSLGWYSNDPTDCRAWIHIGANWNEAGMCTTRVYENPANVIIFVDDGYRGGSKRFDPGWYDLNALGIGNDQLSSARVPPGWTATLFWDAGFSGPWNHPPLVLASDTSYVGNDWNDQASSMIVAKLPGAPN
jgi:hypothetical protein